MSALSVRLFLVSAFAAGVSMALGTQAIIAGHCVAVNLLVTVSSAMTFVYVLVTAPERRP